MVNDLSPICKALIGLFATQREPLTVAVVEQQLPEADQAVMHDTLQMLVRADVVRQAVRRVRYSHERQLVYWLAGNDVGSFAGTQLHYPPEPTLADVAGIQAGQGASKLTHTEAHELRILRLAQRAISNEIECVTRGLREVDHD